MLDADRGTFLDTPKDDPDQAIPVGLLTTLRRTWVRICERFPKGKEMEEASFDHLIAHSMLRFWVETFKDLQKFFDSKRGLFSSERFIKSRPSANRQVRALLPGACGLFT